ncbi:hypothetical protein C7974DRAFT_30070 [Boeremia exigua]|uniref:uncharacterized protein n=1 Tax=Boeremia exigua TaxID=749465 RepID=UPI001E8CC02C|nr:uncharacterized protein C7974DRAFT_30070 [Boeremia exigua]KAH6644895.1 hypothetical protein C7974DRAFT_30070 [Boeremia exigua]
MSLENLGFDSFPYGMMIQGFLAGMKKKITGQKHPRWSFYNLIGNTRKNPDSEKVPHELWPALHAGLCRRLDRKKLFQTQHGRLGIASPEVKIGDSIILLRGCNLPMVARPDGEKWRLIAPSHIPQDGIMEGDLWETAPLRLFVFL